MEAAMQRAETHKPRKGDGKRQEEGSRDFDHGLQDERGSGTFQMRDAERGAYSALVPTLRAATAGDCRMGKPKV